MAGGSAARVIRTGCPGAGLCPNMCVERCEEPHGCVWQDLQLRAAGRRLTTSASHASRRAISSCVARWRGTAPSGGAHSTSGAGAGAPCDSKLAGTGSSASLQAGNGSRCSARWEHGSCGVLLCVGGGAPTVLGVDKHAQLRVGVPPQLQLPLLDERGGHEDGCGRGQIHAHRLGLRACSGWQAGGGEEASMGWDGIARRLLRSQQ